MFKKLSEMIRSFIGTLKFTKEKKIPEPKKVHEFKRLKRFDYIRNPINKKQLSTHEVMLKVARDPNTLRDLDYKFLLNEDIVMLALRKNGHLYSILPDSMKNNIKIARGAHYQTGEILSSFPPEIAERIIRNKKRVAAKGIIKAGKRPEVIQEIDGQIIKKGYDNNFKILTQEVISKDVKS